MHYTEKAQIPGLLILIDFQKAFDSISWNFIYKTLSFLGFSNEFLRWIKLFNTDIKATVLQSGFMCEFISTGRGCQQGDPISPYLFIIAAQILNLFIIKNAEIKGITIKAVLILEILKCGGSSPHVRKNVGAWSIKMGTCTSANEGLISEAFVCPYVY